MYKRQAVQYSIWFDHPKIHDAVERAKPRLHGLRCIQDQKEGKLLLQDGALLFKPKYAKKYSRTLSQSQILSLSWELGVADEEPDIDAAPVTLPYKKFGATHPIQLQVTSYLNGNLAIQKMCIRDRPGIRQGLAVSEFQAGRQRICKAGI